MVTGKSIYSTYFQEYVVNGAQLDALHRELLSSFKDVKEYCDSHNIDYMVGGGTLLGAIRHKGFIPWDDDIDIMMTRENYMKFAEDFAKYLGDKYILAEPLDDKYYYKMPKVYKKNTTYVEISNAGLDSYNMLFIDVFILENIPDSFFMRKLRSIVYDFAYKAASVCIDYLYPSPIIEEKAKTNIEVAKYYNLRKRLGKICSFFGKITFYLKVCERFAQYSCKTSLIGCPSGISYDREVLPAKVYQEIDVADFCGLQVKIPKYYDVYLRNLYGANYMNIPPINKREYHVAYKIEL